MVFVTLTALFTIYVMPVGRRLFALRQIHKLARDRALKRVLAAANAAISQNTAVLDMEILRRAASGEGYGPVAQELDTAVDNGVTGMDGYLKSQIQTYGTDSKRGKAAAHVRREVFPKGVRPIVKLPFVQEHEAVLAVLKRLESADLAESVAELPDLGEMMAHLARQNRLYGAALVKGNEPVVSAQEFRAADAKGQELFLEVVGVIVAEFAGQEDKSGRDELLTPVGKQQEAMRLARRRRRAATDIDPDTGDELPLPGDEPADTDEQAAQAE